MIPAALKMAVVCAMGAALPLAVGTLRPVRSPGIDFLHRNSPTSQKYVIETMCGGAALVDYDNDGLLDVFFVNGGRLDDPVKDSPSYSRGEPAYWNRLYRQNRDGTFSDVTVRAGVAAGGYFCSAPVSSTRS